MKNLNIDKYEFWLPIIASVIYFFTVKQVIPKISYAVFASLTGAYFFPIKLFLDKTMSDNILENRLVELISILIFTLISGFSILLLFENTNANLKISFELLSIINVLFVLYYSITDNRKNTFITHLAFTVLTAALLGV